MLDVEPFLRRARLGDAHTEAICLWNGVGTRGDVKLVDDIQEQHAFVKLPASVPLVSFHRLPSPRPSTDATFHEVAGVGEQATTLDAPAATPTLFTPARGQRRRWWPWAAGGGLLAVGGVAVALSASTGGRCAGPDLAGTWRFDTEVRHTKVGRESARGARGHYTVSFESPAADCTVPATVIKTGFTEAGRSNAGQLADRVTFAPSPSGWSAAANTHIAGGSGVVDVAFRVARHGSALVGVWRYKGESWRIAGFADGLAGAAHAGRGTATGAIGIADACFNDCVERCPDAEDPLAVESEDCLRRCAPRLDDCGG